MNNSVLLSSAEWSPPTAQNIYMDQWSSASSAYVCRRVDVVELEALRQEEWSVSFPIPPAASAPPMSSVGYVRSGPRVAAGGPPRATNGAIKDSTACERCGHKHQTIGTRREAAAAVS
ncbi:unnamed protein product [Lampetra planeri]